MAYHYRASFVKWNKATNIVVSHSYMKDFLSVQDALDWQYKHGQYGYDYMINGVMDTRTGEQLKLWEHTNPMFDINVEAL